MKQILKVAVVLAVPITTWSAEAPVVVLKPGENVVLCKTNSYDSVIHALNQELQKDRIAVRITGTADPKIYDAAIEKPFSVSAPALMMIKTDALYARACVTVTKE